MGHATAVEVAVFVVLAFIVIYYVAAALAGRTSEGMVISPRARDLHREASDLFAKRGGAVSFGEFRRRVPDADAVQFSDTWRLYRNGKLTPAAVQREVLV